ncbi:MAG: AMP-binding protein [Clostridiaceae bacterium]|jgi:long-chain acyl-CoA synthetase|nr:AMP-binding protein [Clostridiaceae bacterium]
MNQGYELSYEKGRKIVKGLGNYPATHVSDIRDLVKKSREKYGSKTAYKFKRDGLIIEKTYIDLDNDVDALGTALHNLGLKDGYISILSENRYEWGVAYFSIVNGTGVAVPLDKYLPENEVENLVSRGRVEAIFYSGAYHEMMLSFSKKENTIRYFICMDEIELPLSDKRFVKMSTLTERGKALLNDGDKSFAAAQIDKEKMSILLFTSGTTKMSKGVMLSHKNIVSNVSSVSALLEVYPTDTHLSILPLHHTFENTIGLMFMILSGVTICYSEGIRHLAQNIKEFNVTILVGVPAIFEAIYSRVMDGIEKQGKTKLINTMRSISGFLLKLGIDIRRRLFRPVMDKLGPDLRLFVSGAAPLSVDILNGFESFGITFLQGYGLTETSPVISVTSFYHNAPGTIGIPVKDVEVTIDNPDENGMGEILVRGQNVMLGYYENPEETKEVMLEEGWLRTGDLGIIDDRCYLRITGRAKTMIVFTNGKKAFPEEYEVQLNIIPGVKESFVWGNKASDGAIQVCAKIVLDKDFFEQKGYSDKQIGDEIEAAIRRMNEGIPKYKILRYFLLTYEELAKTTKMSIKRNIESDKMMMYLDKVGVDIRKINKSFIE